MIKTKLLSALLLVLICTNTIKGQENFPAKEKRIYALSQIWKEVHNYFAFPENLRQANVDSLYISYLDKVEKAKDEYEYYRILSAFMANLKDAHTRIYLDKRVDDMPPLLLSQIERNIVVSNISQKLAHQIPIGSKILKVNNIPVDEYIKDSVYQFISAATEHFRHEKAIKELLYGRPQSTCSLTFQTPENKKKEITICRNFYSNHVSEPMMESVEEIPINIKFLKGEIGYIKLGSFVNIDTIETVFNTYLPKLHRCKGLIIDVRENRGGSDAAWHNIAFHLLPDSVIPNEGKWFSRKLRGYCKMHGEYDPRFQEYYLETALEEIFFRPYKNTIPPSAKLNQPLVILSGRYTASAAEDFLLLMKEQKRAKIMGTASAGCIGAPLFVKLSDHCSAMICAQKYVARNGTQPNITGILPDIKIEEDYDAYLKGRDIQLEAAIQKLYNENKE